LTADARALKRKRETARLRAAVDAALGRLSSHRLRYVSRIMSIGPWRPLPAEAMRVNRTVAVAGILPVYLVGTFITLQGQFYTVKDAVV
jgi:hypothetical protein